MNSKARLNIRWCEFTKDLEYLVRMRRSLVLDPYWNVHVVDNQSHDYMYSDSCLLLKPEHILKDIMYAIKKLEDFSYYICGLERKYFSKDPRAFILEVLTPDWCSTEPVELEDCSVEDAREIEEINLMRSSNFNAPKIYCIIKYIKESLFEDMSDIEFIGLATSSCFRHDMCEEYCVGSSIEDTISNLYDNNKLRRSD